MNMAAGVYLSEAQNPIPPPPPTQCILVYRILIYTGKGGGEGWRLNQREGYRGNSSQSWVENANLTNCISSLHIRKL